MTNLTGLDLLLGIGILAATAFAIHAWQEGRAYRAWQREQAEREERTLKAAPR